MQTAQERAIRPSSATIRAIMAEFSFGPFMLNDAAKRLLGDGVEVSMRPQAFAALRARVAHSGQFLDDR